MCWLLFSRHITRSQLLQHVRIIDKCQVLIWFIKAFAIWKMKIIIINHLNSAFFVSQRCCREAFQPRAPWKSWNSRKPTYMPADLTLKSPLYHDPKPCLWCSFARSPTCCSLARSLARSLACSLVRSSARARACVRHAVPNLRPRHRGAVAGPVLGAGHRHRPSGGSHAL